MAKLNSANYERIKEHQITELPAETNIHCAEMKSMIYTLKNKPLTVNMERSKSVGPCAQQYNPSI
jgi:hypothetical protein